MRITVPANAIVSTHWVADADESTKAPVRHLAQYIDIHVVSPNGPSNHLMIELPPPPRCSIRLSGVQKSLGGPGC